MKLAKKYLRWLEEYGLSSRHRAQRIILNRMLQVADGASSLSCMFLADSIIRDVVNQTGFPIKDKSLFIRSVLDGLYIEAGAETHLSPDGFFEVEIKE